MNNLLIELSTEGRTRTGTRFEPHWILSPARLPIPPLRQLIFTADFFYYKPLI